MSAARAGFRKCFGALPFVAFSAAGACQAAPVANAPPGRARPASVASVASSAATAPTAVTAEQPRPNPQTTRVVDPELSARFCGRAPGPARITVQVLKDSAGNIGGYSEHTSVLDSPIQYLDREGKPLALFHIFGSAEERRKNAPIIAALTRAFPIEEPLVCPEKGAP